ncbi:MAG: hypothetical protein ACLUVG_21265 [Phocaeicola vulgatus]
MEEFEGVKPGELAALKRIIAQDNVTQRKAYDIEAFTLSPPLLLHREHQQPAVPGRTSAETGVSSHHRHRHRLPHPGEPHPGIYAQALALLKGGFRYWYEGEEIEQLNKHNERHRMKDPVEENLFVFFRKPLPEDLQVVSAPLPASY